MHEPFDTLRSLFPSHLHDRVRLVGGAVRDLLLGRPVVDLDLAAALPSDVLMQLGFRLVTGKSTAPIWLRHLPTSGNIEITPLTEMSGLDGDLRRRDFTVNAMAMSLGGELHDPLGGGNDLELRLLRPCSDAIFTDDPLRVFRAFRFAADGWELSQECSHLIRTSLPDEMFSRIPVERFTREMLKALESETPDRFFLLMHKLDCGHEYLPELFEMPLVPAGPPVHHPEGDLLTHSLQVLKRAAVVSAAPLTRFCAFFHDLGKLATPPNLYPRHHGHEEAGYRAAPALCQRLKLPAEYGTCLAWVSRLHGKLYRWDEMRDETKLLTAEQALRAGIRELLPLVAAADKNEDQHQPDGWEAAVNLAGLATDELGISHAELDAVEPERRRDMIRQRRVDMYRANRTSAA